LGVQAFGLLLQGLMRPGLHDAAPVPDADVARVVAYLGAMGSGKTFAIGRALGVKMDRTWSCYSGGPVACGSCPACKKRETALL
jgi:7-cyano-7-deazaguanine synthase